MASHELARTERGQLLTRAVRPATNRDVAGIDQVQEAVGVVRSQNMLAPSELDAADPAHASQPARGLEPAERLRCFETTQSLFLVVHFGCCARGGGGVL